MNAQQRAPYRLLAEIEMPEGEVAGLCLFCKYAKWHGGSACGGEAELECTSVMQAKVDWDGELTNETWAGERDCWWFRPKYKRDVCVDIVGIYLRGEYPDFAALARKI